MVLQFINLKAFLISLSIGLLYIYLSEEYKKVVIIYPTPDNVNDYDKDTANNCFSYQLQETDCPSSSENMVR